MRRATERGGSSVIALALFLAIALLVRSRIPPTSPMRATFTGLTIALVVAALLGMIFVVLPTFLVQPHPELDQEKLLKARNDVRIAGIQIVGGAALLVGLVFTNRTLGLNQQGQITDRFTKATDQLGSDELPIRLGGVYSLERIARDSKPDQGPVMEVLTAYVRVHSSSAPTAATSSVGSSTTTTATPVLPTDVQAVLTVVGRRILDNDPPEYRLDLYRANLSTATLAGDHRKLPRLDH